MERIKTYTFKKSSNLKSMSYDEKRKSLVVKFLGGGEYVYFHVPFCVFQGLKRAKSAGKYFWRQVRDFYDYERL